MEGGLEKDHEGATIFALSTAPGTAGIAVIRLSGPRAHVALAALAGPRLPPPRRASLRMIRDAEGGAIDEALILVFEAGESHTGELMAEIHCHGGRAVVAGVLACLAGQPGLRVAEPGEFTRRAFLNGRMDLTEVEAVGDLLAAETEAQRRFALAGMRGRLRRAAETWREALLRALALIEVTIDWADEDVPEDVLPEVREILTRLAAELDRELAGADVTERLREGFTVALIGAPNVGKSSLLNALAGREAALISDVPGTTRDVIEVPFNLKGLPVTFVDTAGVRVSEDVVERLGIARTIERAEEADLRVFLECPGCPVPSDALRLRRDGDLVVRTKADLGADADGPAVSAVTGVGIGGVLEAIGDVLDARVALGGMVGNTRQKLAVSAARKALGRGLAALPGGDVEIVAAELWDAVRALEELAGRTGAEDLLDTVFRNFCLGK